MKKWLDEHHLIPGKSARRVGRMMALAALVGVVSGIGAVLFHLMTLAITHYAMGKVTHYEQGGPANEKEWVDIVGRDEVTDESREPIPWLLLVVPTVGGLFSGFLVYRYAPEAEGHGTDGAIDAYHNNKGIIRPQVPIVKMFASAITLGTGGSGGREGPIAQIGAGFGSYLATRLGLTDSQRRALLAAGLGAGIGSIFHAPLAGAIFACEVLYREADFDAENLVPAFIATTVAYSVFALPFGSSAFAPLFAVHPDLSFTRPLPLLAPLAVLAFTMAIMALIYTKAFYGTHHFFKKLHIPNMFKPAIGALLTGALAVALFYGLKQQGHVHHRDALNVLASGYGFLQRVLSNPGQIGITLLLVVGLGKLLTTCLTIGSGGSGGVFGPSVVIGGSLGAVVGLLFHDWIPQIVHEGDVIVFVLLGMASFFAAAAKTPMSTLIMVSEMCSSYVLLLPSMWVCALAYMISTGWSLYDKQVATRRDSPAHRSDFIIDILQGLTVNDAMQRATTSFVTAPKAMPLGEMAKLITDTRQTCFPVVDENGKYTGVFSLNDIRQFVYDNPLADLAVAEDLATTAYEPLTPQTSLSDAISRFTDVRFEELPVVDQAQPDKVIGLLRRHELIATYNAQLLQMRQ